MVNSIYGSSNPYGTSALSGMNFDYKAAQQQVKAAYASNKINTSGSATSNSVTSLKKDSAKFLSDYSTDMKNMEKAASAVSDGKFGKALYANGASPEEVPTDENIKAATEQLQKMVDAYNKSLTTVNTNMERGTGVARQASRMARPPVSQKSMEMIGITTNKDGTLKLDQTKLGENLKGSSAQRELTAGVVNDIAEGIRSDAKSGLNESSASLINRDLASIKQEQQNTENPIFMMSMYSKSGSYNMMNMGTIGLMMNTFA